MKKEKGRTNKLSPTTLSPHGMPDLLADIKANKDKCFFMFAVILVTV